MCRLLLILILFAVVKPFFLAWLLDAMAFIWKGNVHWAYLDDEERMGWNCLCYDIHIFKNTWTDERLVGICGVQTHSFVRYQIQFPTVLLASMTANGFLS
jgi:hypothetical protein